MHVGTGQVAVIRDIYPRKILIKVIPNSALLLRSPINLCSNTCPLPTPTASPRFPGFCYSFSSPAAPLTVEILQTHSGCAVGVRREGASRGRRVHMADHPVGTLKVLVVRGKRLAIRDFTSSDPYVVVRVGNQTLKTKVINSCLNPVWNEELTFTVTEPVGVLKLEVFDRDRFKADDKMGRAHLNLQPLALSSRLRRALRLSAGETKLRKVAPDSDNCLLAESFITYVDGEIVQDVRLRLCDVESGEVELKLRWVDNQPDAQAAAS